MSDPAIYGLICAVVLLFWAVGAYNRVVRLRTAIGTAFAQLDSQLVERHAVVLRLSDSLGQDDSLVERGTLDAACRQARAALDLARRHSVTPGPIVSLGLAEQVLDASVTRLVTLAPPSDEQRAVLAELSAASMQLTFARQQFNGAVRAYNLAVQQAPTNLLCYLYGFGSTAELPDAGVEPSTVLLSA